MAALCRLFAGLKALSVPLSGGAEVTSTRISLLVRTLSSPVAAEAPAGESAEKEAVRFETKQWSPQSRRTGVIAVKLGMTQLWDEQGSPMAVTVLQVKGCGFIGSPVSPRALCSCSLPHAEWWDVQA